MANISQAQAKALAEGFLDTVGSRDLNPVESMSALILLAGSLVDQAQQNLNKVDRVASGSLSESMKVLNPESVGNNVRIDVIANFYYKFIDKGVKGVEGGSTGTYSFKNLHVSKRMMEAIRKWLLREGLKARTHTGGKPIVKREAKRKKITSTSTQAAYAIARGIKKTGLKRTNFFTDAVRTTRQQAKTQLAKGLKLDIINALPKKINGTNNPT